MAKHFKPPKEHYFNTPENTRWFAVDRKTPDSDKMFEHISLDNLPEGCYGFSVNGGPRLEIDITKLFYEGVERVYIFDKSRLQYNLDEEF